MAKHEITIHENTGATVVTATGCTSMATQPQGQTTEINPHHRLDFPLLAARGELRRRHECPHQCGKAGCACDDCDRQIVPTTGS